jgi:hypothetical protein
MLYSSLPSSDISTSVPKLLSDLDEGLLKRLEKRLQLRQTYPLVGTPVSILQNGKENNTLTNFFPTVGNAEAIKS